MGLGFEIGFGLELGLGSGLRLGLRSPTLTLTLTLALTRFGPGGVTAAVPPRLPTPSPDLLKKHQVAHQEAIRQPDPLTPLCMDHRALENTQDTTTGTGMALPGKYFLKGGMAADNPGLV